MSDVPSPAPPPEAAPRLRPWVLLLWLAAAFLSTLCGIGGGIFAVPILHYLARLPMRNAVGTSLLLVLAMTVTATAVEALRADSGLDWIVVLLLLLGSVPGAHYGYRFALKVDARTLKVLFAVFLALAAARTVTLPASLGENSAGRVIMTPAQGAWVAVIGFGGGFLAPLLGVGGGILVIPALFLTLPGASYLEARACSMAMSVANAAQSSWFYMRDGHVRARLALPLTVAAVGAALAGVLAVHQPGWAEAAKVLLAAVLGVVAARFGMDVWRSRRGALEARTPP